jgi:uncharacterized membrane protein YbhN (UPF0104 family)
MTRRRILLALSLAAALFGAYLFYGVLQRYEFRDVVHSLQSTSLRGVMFALALTAGSFLCISAMEVLAVRYAERGQQVISWARIWRTTVAALGVGHSLGLSALSSGAIRYRMYGRRGLGLTAIGEIVVFSGISVGLGLGSVGGLALVWHGETRAASTPSAPPASRSAPSTSAPALSPRRRSASSAIACACRIGVSPSPNCSSAA